ncbi:hypothetical protein MYCTH_2060238 [Thermothelomyces thermophilus ATCC 42464]|uniref:Uncharacterized protein n=1 Tax=Thermothelomyces thermophilus (strain ATCC 42464 / BCRC 31852 / DSM 1799) TaxID=573729 RepID=G2QCR8_THET4|nr:uncharacterized protein MYCTH_2060238 [Thermothelomyces thermophilus ATCC 42464]AEO58190.1 hypothetical protein MYCTH_2060238 [Thermothelomyces thermophilus ATCC 42464]
MCLTKVYYNTYADGAQDITEKSYPCRDGRRCSHPEVRRYDRKFPFTRLADVQAESRRSLSERQPTPYFSSRTPRSAKSSSPSGRRDSGIYMGGGSNPSSKHHDSHDLYAAGGYDTYGYRSSSKRHDPRDSLDSRYDRDRDRDRDRELRLKRTVTDPHIVYVDRGRDDGKSSRSRSRSSSRDIPLGLVPVAEEYGRRRRRHSTSLERDSSDYGYYSGLNHADAAAAPSRRRTDDPKGYVIYDDDDERRRQRREAKRRNSTSGSGYPDEAAAALPVSMMDPYGSAYVPRRAPGAAVVHHHIDGSASTATGSSSSASRKQLRWEDEVRARRERQNAEIASRPRLSTTTTTTTSGEIKGILKRSASDPWGGKSKSKGKAREEADDIADLRRAIERMEIPRGRDRQPRGRDEWDWSGSGGGGGGYGYGYDEMESGKRSKRSRIYAGDGYRY